MRKHQPYRFLQQIQSPLMIFFILTLNLILALPFCTERFTALISVTCKFSKRVTTIPEIDTLTTKKWAHVFCNRLDLLNLNLWEGIITNQDPKFLCQFWMILFHILGVSLLYSTAYYPETDSSSERSNQTINIALQFYVHIWHNPSF